MKWFNNKKKKLEMIQAIRPTSRATLKLQCLFATKGDIDEAAKLYDYFAKDLPELPDYDPVQPTWIDRTGDIANGIVSWIGNNRDTLAQGYEILRGITGGKLPPLTTTIEAVGDEVPLPSINE